jgi:hypothetical protein
VTAGSAPGYGQGSYEGALTFMTRIFLFLAALSVGVVGCDDPPEPPDAAAPRDGGGEAGAREGGTEGGAGDAGAAGDATRGDAIDAAASDASTVDASADGGGDGGDAGAAEAVDAASQG